MTERAGRGRRPRAYEERELAVKLIQALDDGLAAAARAVGIGRGRARRLLAQYGVPVGVPTSKLPASLDIAAFAEGLTTAKAGELLEVSHQTIARALRKAGVKRRRGQPRKIDPAVVEEMRTCGYTYQQIADVLGVSLSGIHRAFRDGKTCSRRLDPADVVELREKHGFGWAHIGQHLDCHPDTAKKLYYKARRTCSPGQPAAPG